ncbi:MAG: TetR/AcrR family transcriptional regulator [Lachnospirales bacterium]
MYHIKTDKRSIKSSELIYQGLSKCMDEKEFNKITITDIQKASTVGRATFYRNFDNITDVLYWQCDIHYKEVMTNYIVTNVKTIDHYHFLKYFFDYWFLNSRILEQIISIGHYDIIFSCHFKSSFILSEKINVNETIPSEFYEYYISSLIGAFVGLLVTWISKGKTLNAEDFINMLKNSSERDMVKLFL